MKIELENYMSQENQHHSLYVNGFISIDHGQKNFITNPTTCKSIARVGTRRLVEKSMIGYDSVNNQYK